MCVGVHARCHANLHIDLRTEEASYMLKAFNFIETVNNDVMHAFTNGVVQFIRRLVVAVQYTAIGRHTSTECYEEFSTCCHVEHEAFFVHQFCHFSTQERFGGIDHISCTKRFAGFAAAITNVLLVVDKEWRTELSSKARHQAPTNREFPCRLNERCVG